MTSRQRPLDQVGPEGACEDDPEPENLPAPPPIRRGTADRGLATRAATGGDISWSRQRSLAFPASAPIES